MGLKKEVKIKLIIARKFRPRGMEQAGACLDWLYVGKTFIPQCRGGSRVNSKVHSPHNQKKPPKNPDPNQTKNQRKQN